MTNPPSSNIPVRAILDDFSWFPDNTDIAAKSVSFVHTDRETVAAQTFLDYRWNRENLAKAAFSYDQIVAAIPEQAPPPELGFIWHTSFCCSTLIARALDASGRNWSLCEPMALVHVADAKRAGMMAKGQVTKRLPEIFFRLYGRSSQSGEKVLVKPSNFANVLVADAARLSHGKHLFLYSDLASFLTAVARGGLPMRKYARRLFTNIAGDAGEPLPWSGPELIHMTDLEMAAIAWHMQIAQFQRAHALLGPARAASLDCDAFLADPRGALLELDAFFGLGLGMDHVASVVSGPLFRHHAKNPQVPFDPTARSRENAAVRTNLGGELGRVIAWSYRACPGTPRAVPVSNPLIPMEKSYGGSGELA